MSDVIVSGRDITDVREHLRFPVVSMLEADATSSARNRIGRISPSRGRLSDNKSATADCDADGIQRKLFDESDDDQGSDKQDGNDVTRDVDDDKSKKYVNEKVKKEKRSRNKKSRRRRGGGGGGVGDKCGAGGEKKGRKEERCSGSRTGSGGSTTSGRYKTELCRTFDESGECRYGNKCQFAHGESELRVVDRHVRYKTDLCRTFHAKGFCPYGVRCHFVHNELDRMLDMARKLLKQRRELLLTTATSADQELQQQEQQQQTQSEMVIRELSLQTSLEKHSLPTSLEKQEKLLITKEPQQLELAAQLQQQQTVQQQQFRMMQQQQQQQQQLFQHQLLQQKERSRLQQQPQQQQPRQQQPFWQQTHHEQQGILLQRLIVQHLLTQQQSSVNDHEQQQEQEQQQHQQHLDFAQQLINEMASCPTLIEDCLRSLQIEECSPTPAPDHNSSYSPICDVTRDYINRDSSYTSISQAPRSFTSQRSAFQSYSNGEILPAASAANENLHNLFPGKAVNLRNPVNPRTITAREMQYTDRSPAKESNSIPQEPSSRIYRPAVASFLQKQHGTNFEPVDRRNFPCAPSTTTMNGLQALRETALKSSYFESARLPPVSTGSQNRLPFTTFPSDLPQRCSSFSESCSGAARLAGTFQQVNNTNWFSDSSYSTQDGSQQWTLPRRRAVSIDSTGAEVSSHNSNYYKNISWPSYTSNGSSGNGSSYNSSSNNNSRGSCYGSSCSGIVEGSMLENFLNCRNAGMSAGVVGSLAGSFHEYGSSLDGGTGSGGLPSSPDASPVMSPGSNGSGFTSRFSFFSQTSSSPLPTKRNDLDYMVNMLSGMFNTSPRGLLQNEAIGW